MILVQPGVVFRKIERKIYLLRKYFASFSKPTIMYTKLHPIYTSIFENAAFGKYNFVFLNVRRGYFNTLETILFKKASLIHADSANFPGLSVSVPMIVECEAKPYDIYFESDKVHKILVESKIAGKGFWDNSKVALCYPTIAIQRKAPIIKDSGPITLLCVGFGGYIKGYDVVYRLYKALASKFNIRLIIAGSLGHDFEVYKEVTREAYDRAGFDMINNELQSDASVTMRPYRRTTLLNDVYPRADIFIQMSRMETFGYSILEAMSFGLPVVSCDFTAIREIVEDGGNGYLVKSNVYSEETNEYAVDINSEQWGENCFSEALEYLTQLVENPDLRKRMGTRSLEIVDSKFNVRNKISFLDALYTECLFNHPAA